MAKKIPLGAEPVSVIMPVMNNLGYTKSCLESIYKNTSTPYEMIIINNASTDGTKEFLDQEKAGKDFFHVHSMKSNIGVSPSWNLGISLARYDYICIINNDIEILSENWLYEMQQRLKASDKIYWTSPRTCYTKDMNKIRYRPHHYEQLRYSSSSDSYVVACCFMCPKKIFGENEIGLFDTEFQVKYYEDLDYINRIMQAGKKISMAHNVLVYHSVGATSRGTPGGENNERYYKEKWGGTQFDILAKQENRGKGIKHFD